MSAPLPSQDPLKIMSHAIDAVLDAARWRDEDGGSCLARLRENDAETLRRWARDLCRG